MGLVLLFPGHWSTFGPFFRNWCLTEIYRSNPAPGLCLPQIHGPVAESAQAHPLQSAEPLGHRPPWISSRFPTPASCSFWPWPPVTLLRSCCHTTKLLVASSTRKFVHVMDLQPAGSLIKLVHKLSQTIWGNLKSSWNQASLDSAGCFSSRALVAAIWINQLVLNGQVQFWQALRFSSHMSPLVLQNTTCFWSSRPTPHADHKLLRIYESCWGKLLGQVVQDGANDLKRFWGMTLDTWWHLNFLTCKAVGICYSHQSWPASPRTDGFKWLQWTSSSHTRFTSGSASPRRFRIAAHAAFATLASESWSFAATAAAAWGTPGPHGQKRQRQRRQRRQRPAVLVVRPVGQCVHGRNTNRTYLQSKAARPSCCRFWSTSERWDSWWKALTINPANIDPAKWGWKAYIPLELIIVGVYVGWLVTLQDSMWRREPDTWQLCLCVAGVEVLAEWLTHGKPQPPAGPRKGGSNNLVEGTEIKSDQEKMSLHVSSVTRTGVWKVEITRVSSTLVSSWGLLLASQHFLAKSLEPPWGLQESTNPAEFVPAAFWLYRPAT